MPRAGRAKRAAHLSCSRTAAFRVPRAVLSCLVPQGSEKFCAGTFLPPLHGEGVAERGGHSQAPEIPIGLCPRTGIDVKHHEDA